MSRIRKISGPALSRNWITDPARHQSRRRRHHRSRGLPRPVEQGKREEQGRPKLTMLAFLIKACVAALKKIPGLQQLDRSGGRRDHPQELLAHRLRGRHAQRPRRTGRSRTPTKGIFEIAQETRRWPPRRATASSAPADMQGGTFSISSLGGIGGTYFTPIINAPEVAILGVCRSTMKPVWDGKQFVPRLILPLSLSWDHRVVDGAARGALQHDAGADAARTSGACCCSPRSGETRALRSMTTIVVVKKGEARLRSPRTHWSRSAKPGCRMATRPTRRSSRSAIRCIGLAGSTAHFAVFAQALRTSAKKCS